MARKDIEYQILELFKRNPNKELSTYDVVYSIFPAECRVLEKDESDLDKVKRNNAKVTLARFHRVVLYYLNKLIDDEIIKVSKEGSKGIKYFVLSLGEGEEVMLKKHKRRIIISKPAMPATPIEGYEQKGMVFKLSPTSWVDRLNAVLLESKKFKNFEDIFSCFSKIISEVNDVVCLNDFETLIERENPKEFALFIKKIDEECSSYGKLVCIVIDMTNIGESRQKITDFFEEFGKSGSETISFIFDTKSKELQGNIELMKKIVECCLKYKIPLNIKNQEQHQAPYMIGRAGPYTVDENEWKDYKRNHQDHCMAVCIGQATIAIDVADFFNEIKDVRKFRSLVMNVAKALMSCNSMQRRFSDDYFKNFMKIAHPETRVFFNMSRNFIRFWNYELKEPDMEKEYMFDLIKNIKALISNFCATEETIYKSAGMPIRFKIAFSCLFREFSDVKVSEGKYQKISVRKLEDLYSEEIKNFLEAKERINEVFDGGDHTRFYRFEEGKSSDIVREIGVILNTYKLPFFCYDFGQLRASNLKLTSFMK